jgi:hypothetical protein
MRKLIIAGMAVAMLGIIPAAASADVPRCEASVPTNTVIKTATFTIIQPAQEYKQWNRLWTHSFTVTINPENNTFAGVGEISGDDQNGTFDQQFPHDALVPDETVTGTYAEGKVTLKATRVGDGLVTELANAPTGDMSLTAPITVATLSINGSTLDTTADPIEFKVSVPDITEKTTTTPGTGSVTNHGQFVKAQGGGKTAAQACAGMPLNSTQGSSFLK